MALPGEGEYMATRHERSKMSLHNFTLPNLKWGSQRHLMCMKTESDGGSLVGDQRLRRRSSPSKLYRRSYNQNLRSETEEGIGEFAEKILLDIRTETESIFRKQGLGDEEEEEEEMEMKREETERPEREVSPPEAPGTTAEARPWNLRKRRAACKAPITEGLGFVEEKRVNLGKESTARCREKKEERPRFLLSLSKKEIEDDFMDMMGHRPPRRPKKRPRTIQKTINVLYPAYYLPEVITEDMYKIPDTAETGKR